MEPIPEELVEEIWQETAGFSPDQINKRIKKLSKSQPNLLAFIIEFSQDLDRQVKELAMYMFFVVFRMFKKSSHKIIKRISPEKIIEYYEKNENFIQSQEGVHEKFFERITRLQLSEQPYVLKYVTETLMEAPYEEDPIILTEQDAGFVFMLLKTVVDVLDKQT
ncbi:MAG: hypothetical protein DRH24_13105 [Deltaproteobacteria bacterium]|nr:MAG: hypothetical protein DRH24_13105 [Deltaproteobacteria bacterium]